MDYRNVTSKPADRVKKDKLDIKGTVSVKKTSELSKDATDFKNVMVKQVLIPAAQRTVMELVRATCQEFTRAVEKRIFGREVFGDALFTSAPLGSRPRTNYSALSTARRYEAYRDPYSRDYRVIDSVRTSRFPLKALGFSSYDGAKAVLERLRDDISEIGMVSVGDYYEYCDEASEYTDCKYGWTNLSNAKVVPDRDGNYSLSLPAPEMLAH